MVKIRHGMFETNSSSTHTIIVTDQNCEPGAIVDFQIGEFGWGFHELRTVDEKASYLYTAACEFYNRDMYQNFYETLCKYGVKCTCTRPALFEKQTNWLKNGYIDHCYEGDMSDFVETMLNHEKALIRYLFSPDSFVLTGNDNCTEEQYERMQKTADVWYRCKKYYKGN